eukprot:TRINITY_DN17088_c0_g1_i1.p1 TRINITY_DN17088_c0_g1~~TRINITY_DN17088_c0_g1_i1.p1  ORF type:complete len:665 (+),score=128.08 TRINITY_DN17088_c0_g1_i1:191-1996(+)
MAVASAVLITGSFTQGSILTVSHCTYIVAATSAVAVQVLTDAPPRRVNQIAIGVCVFGVITGDVKTVFGLQLRHINLMMLVVDMSLVAQIGSGTIHTALAATTVWALVQSVDSVVDFGVREIVEFGGDLDIPPVCDCSNPPCTVAAGSAATSLVTLLLVFYIDYYITRMFAHGMISQTDAVKVSIQVAEEVAALLAQYKTDEAQAILSSTVSLPGNFRATLVDLACNLRRYRPFLPQYCLGVSDTASASRGSASDSIVAARCVSDVTDRSKRLPHAINSPEDFVAARESSVSSLGSLQDTKLGSMLAGALSACKTMTRRGGTVVVGNLRRYLSAVDVICIPTFHEELISAWTEAVAATLGVADNFSGDRLVANLNCSRPCYAHKANGVRLAASLHRTVGAPPQSLDSGLQSSSWSEAAQVALGMSCGVSSGELLCGVVGSSQFLKHTIIGRCPAWASLLERLACRMDMKLVISDMTRQDVTGFRCRLITTAVLAKPSHQDRTDMLWEVVGEVQDKQYPQEWMYQLQQIEDEDPWAVYNKVAMAYECGDVQTAREVEETFGGIRDPEVAGHAARLLRRISENTPATRVRLHEVYQEHEAAHS